LVFYGPSLSYVLYIWTPIYKEREFSLFEQENKKKEGPKNF
jgi:hypothetical protein